MRLASSVSGVLIPAGVASVLELSPKRGEHVAEDRPDVGRPEPELLDAIEVRLEVNALSTATIAYLSWFVLSITSPGVWLRGRPALSGPATAGGGGR
jgi:hypothetical protein